MVAKHPILEKLGQNIRRHRASQGLSQEGLALNANLDRTYMGGVERGERNVSVINLCKIASALSVEPGLLLEGIDSI